jgi:hypothetical protein
LGLAHCRTVMALPMRSRMWSSRALGLLTLALGPLMALLEPRVGLLGVACGLTAQSSGVRGRSDRRDSSGRAARQVSRGRGPPTRWERQTLVRGEAGDRASTAQRAARVVGRSSDARSVGAFCARGAVGTFPARGRGDRARRGPRDQTLWRSVALPPASRMSFVLPRRSHADIASA